MADWYPDSRDFQLQMVDTWTSVFQSSRAQSWGIPQSLTASLAASASDAKAKLSVVRSGERTPVSVVECNEVFGIMETKARYIKKHHLLIPPLTLADLPALLLPAPDETQSPIGKPDGQPSVTVTYPGGPHILLLRLAALMGTLPPDSRGNYGIAVYKGVMPQGGATLEQAAGPKHYLLKPPLSGDELLHWKFTRRKLETVAFDAAEAGMMAYFCARYENQKGDYGEWGPVAQAVIP